MRKIKRKEERENYRERGKGSYRCKDYRYLFMFVCIYFPMDIFMYVSLYVYADIFRRRGELERMVLVSVLTLTLIYIIFGKS